ncbi:hypothetical protein [Stutzerimonas nitrititolerans]|uniref:hypothetical protein n=1 Tax=Stutzerimonas nitrititolerans TaxID=2482751 RepID=UPI002897C6CE|nr:hypothetical protein [Stutzerimonas nitrititolerans]
MKANHVADAGDAPDEQTVLVAVDAGRMALVGHWVHGVTPAGSRKALASRT